MTDPDNTSWLRLGKLSIAILEHLVEPVLGKDAIAQVKGSYYENELQQTLARVLTRAESRLVASHPGDEIASAMINLPLADLPSIAQAVRRFIDHPDDTGLQKLIGRQLSADYPQFPQERSAAVAGEYIRILKEEIVSSVPEARQKIQALADLSIDTNIKHILDRLDRLMQAHDDASASQERFYEEYIDQIQDLVINHDLKNKDPGSPEVTLAASRTTAVLPKLSGQKKAKVVKFLKQQGLLEGFASYLKDVDLRSVQLQGASLGQVSFSYSDIRDAAFDGANLYGAGFVRANLTGASLANAKLLKAEFFEGNLQNAAFDQADLSGADLSSVFAAKASFTDASMERCYLLEARLVGVNFINTNLRDAFIMRADLSDADLTGANLSGAVLDQTNFTGAAITPEQLSAASSAWGIIYPDGRKDSSKAPARKKALLLNVEDDLDIADMLYAYFTVQGYSVIVRYWGEDAVTFIQRYLPDLVILDIRLPDIDGYEVARRIRANKMVMHIPFIFLTEKRKRDDRLRGYELGADDYITKPFDIQDLRLRVRNALARRERGAMINAVTGFPEMAITDAVIAEKIETPDWAILAVSIKNLDRFRETYGFVAADDVLKAVSVILFNTMKDLGSPSDHIGHLTTTDFAITTTADKVEALAGAIKEELARALAEFYQDKNGDKTGENRMQARQASIRSGECEGKTIDQLKTELWGRVRNS